MQVADYIVKVLHRQGVDTVFELIGGMITYIIDALERDGGIRVISMHHEQGAAFAAEGWARMKRKRAGVALATSGPGAVNLLTGVGSCFFDSIPAVFITGQVNTKEGKGALPVRQLGFQETDIVAMAQPITKWAAQVRRGEDVPEILAKAFTIALSGRPGPVLVDIPIDLQRSECEEIYPKVVSDAIPADTAAMEAFADQLAERLARSERPLILAGNGVEACDGGAVLRRIAEKGCIPVVTSLMGIDLLPAGHPLRVGMLGTYGNRWANWAVGKSDLLIVLGSRLDVRQTSANAASFCDGKDIWQVDADAREIGARITPQASLVAQLEDFLPVLEGKMQVCPQCGAWTAEIHAKEAHWPDTDESAGVGGIDPNKLIKQLSEASPQASAFVVDVGQHQMWAGQSLRPAEGQRILNSGGMGAMGFSLPAAIGAAFASGKPVVAIAGDGCMQINIQELQTIATHRLPVKIVVLCNGALGMVRQFQEDYFGSRYRSTVWGVGMPDFPKLAAAYGIPAGAVHAASELPAALQELWSDPMAPYLLAVDINQKRNTNPKVMFGQPFTHMSPDKA